MPKVRQELSAREVEDMHELLTRRLGDTSVPSLPQVAIKLIELIGNPDATVDRFAEIIQSDQALTGRLLRLANSAMFAQRQPVTTLQRAMVLMGMDRLKAISLGFHLSKAMAEDDGPFSPKRLWTQSLFRAWLALHIAEDIDKKVSGEAFIIGMLCDAGTTAMGRLLGEDFRAAVNPLDTPARQYLSELRSLPFTHVDASSVLARLWRLPPLLARPISLHHTAPQGMSVGDQAGLLHAVAYFVGSIPLDTNGLVRDDTPLPGLAKRLLGLDDDRVRRHLAAAGASFKATREMFAHILDATLSIDSIIETANRHMDEDEAAEVMPAFPTDMGADAPVRAAGLVFEFSKGTGQCVNAVISDESGNRLLCEEIDTGTRDEDEIRGLLLLDDATPEDIKRVLTRVYAVAA